MGCCRDRDKFDKGTDITQLHKRANTLRPGRPFLEVRNPPVAIPLSPELEQVRALLRDRERIAVTLSSQSEGWVTTCDTNDLIIKIRPETSLSAAVPACYLYVDMGALIPPYVVLRVLEDVEVRKKWDPAVSELEVREEMGDLERCYVKYCLAMVVKEVEEKRRKLVTPSEAKFISCSVPTSPFPTQVFFNLLHICTSPRGTTSVTLCYQIDFNLSGLLKSMHEAGLRGSLKKWLESFRAKTRERTNA